MTAAPAPSQARVAIAWGPRASPAFTGVVGQTRAANVKLVAPLIA